LRACETLRRHRNPEAGNPGRYVAAHEREDVEGKKTAREAAVFRVIPGRRRQGCKTLERSERLREDCLGSVETPWALSRAKTPWAGPQPRIPGHALL
jgi:hypothetical protein